MTHGEVLAADERRAAGAVCDWTWGRAERRIDIVPQDGCRRGEVGFTGLTVRSAIEAFARLARNNGGSLPPCA